MDSRYLLVFLAISFGCVLDVFAGGNINCTATTTAGLDVAVQCPLLKGNSDITWKKGDEDVKTTEKKYTVFNENGTLLIHAIENKTGGDYECHNGSVSGKVYVCVSPHVEQFDKAKNVIEGDPLQIECKTWGHPQGSVRWLHGSNAIVADGSNVIFKSDSTENSTVRIKSVTYDEGGDYTCVVTSDVGSTNATLTVNVKDKLAALWPFLGICAEVFILCAIIFLYERRRAKRLEKEAENEEADHMTANNDTKVSEDVRHRK